MVQNCSLMLSKGSLSRLPPTVLRHRGFAENIKPVLTGKVSKLIYLKKFNCPKTLMYLISIDVKIKTICLVYNILNRKNIYHNTQPNELI